MPYFLKSPSCHLSSLRVGPGFFQFSRPVSMCLPKYTVHPVSSLRGFLVGPSAQRLVGAHTYLSNERTIHFGYRTLVSARE